MRILGTIRAGLGEIVGRYLVASVAAARSGSRSRYRYRYRYR